MWGCNHVLCADGNVLSCRSPALITIAEVKAVVNQGSSLVFGLHRVYFVPFSCLSTSEADVGSDGEPCFV